MYTSINLFANRTLKTSNVGSHIAITMIYLNAWVHQQRTQGKYEIVANCIFICYLLFTGYSTIGMHGAVQRIQIEHVHVAKSLHSEV